jgi:hypothetical protein
MVEVVLIKLEQDFDEFKTEVHTKVKDDLSEILA